MTLELKNKDGEIRSIRLKKVLLKSEVFWCQQEMEMLECNHYKLDMDYPELKLSKSHNNGADIQIQVLTNKHTTMPVQLNITCTKLDEIKIRVKA